MNEHCTPFSHSARRNAQVPAPRWLNESQKPFDFFVSLDASQWLPRSLCTQSHTRENKPMKAASPQNSRWNGRLNETVSPNQRIESLAVDIQNVNASGRRLHRNHFSNKRKLQNASRNGRRERAVYHFRLDKLLFLCIFRGGFEANVSTERILPTVVVVVVVDDCCFFLFNSALRFFIL